MIMENVENPAGPVMGDNDIVPFKKRVKLFFKYHWRGVISIVVPILCLPVVLPLPTQDYNWVAYCLLVMAIYWVTECIPLAVTSFLPLIIFPSAEIMNTAEVCQCYVNDTVIMFIGSLMLASAIEQSGLHKRLAYAVIRTVGYSHYRLLFGMSLVTMFVSMWITNTAATVMMVPIIFALLKVLEDQNLVVIFEETQEGERVASSITTCYFCAVTYSATIGGIGTLVGTATNLVFKGLFEKAYPNAPELLSFPHFSAFSIPLMIILEVLIYLCMCLQFLGFMRPRSQTAAAIKIPDDVILQLKAAVDDNRKKLGRLRFWEFMVIVLFTGAMLMFFCRSPKIFTGWADVILSYHNITNKKFIRDSTPAMLVCFLMLLLPSSLIIYRNFTEKDVDRLPQGKVSSVLDWNTLDESMPYSFMFLLGAGFALSTASEKEYSNLNGKIGDLLQSLRNLPNCITVLIIIIFTVFFTNLASNVAVANVVTPIVMTMAHKYGSNPLTYNLAAGISASFCFMLPVGTPGNLVAQSAASIPTQNMIIAGLLPTAVSIVITWGGIILWAPVIWPDLNIKTPWWLVNNTLV